MVCCPRTFSFEHKVVETIREKAAKQNIAEQFEDMLIPTEEVIEIKRGQKNRLRKNIYPVMYW